MDKFPPNCKIVKIRFFYHLSYPLFCLVLLSGCITTNYYTGRTLEQGKTVVTPGVDNLVLITRDEGVIEKDLSFSLSVGVATGLPWRFETGIRTYFPYIWEANLRHQLNPRSFDWFDLSANFHAGVIFSEKFDDVAPPYYKYGFTISKEIFTLQPFVGYYWNNKFEFERDSERNDFEIICFGIAIPFRDDLIIPECNYYRSPSGDFHIYSIGIGLRASLNKPKTKDKK
jgi:hypothetical protein